MKRTILLTLALLSLCWGHALQAQRVDFETLPDGLAPTDRMVISNQFAQAPFGVSFQFEDKSYPHIARVGPPLTAFWGPPNNTVADMPASGQNVGTNFLTDDGVLGAPPPPLIITYSQPVAAASGFILDVDLEEAWDVEARNSQTQVVAQIRLEAHTDLTGDGIATPWSFTRPSADICSIRIAYTGAGNPGLAFDNFSPASPLPTPEPAHLALHIRTNFASLTITGTVFAVYRIEQATSPESTNWTMLTSLVLPFSPFTLTNFVAIEASRRFYRAIGVE